jgi:hypothetical protein
MPTHRPLLSVRSTALAVLWAWLCVVCVSIAAPVVLAQQTSHRIERLCSGEPVPQWAPSPITHAHDGDAAALHHLIDCPLCLPILAPPAAMAQTVGCHALQAVPQEPLHTGQGAPSIQWPPARGPPV